MISKRIFVFALFILPMVFIGCFQDSAGLKKATIVIETGTEDNGTDIVSITEGLEDEAAVENAPAVVEETADAVNADAPAADALEPAVNDLSAADEAVIQQPASADSAPEALYPAASDVTGCIGTTVEIPVTVEDTVDLALEDAIAEIENTTDADAYADADSYSEADVEETAAADASADAEYRAVSFTALLKHKGVFLSGALVSIYTADKTLAASAYADARGIAQINFSIDSSVDTLFVVIEHPDYGTRLFPLKFKNDGSVVIAKEKKDKKAKKNKKQNKDKKEKKEKQEKEKK